MSSSRFPLAQRGFDDLPRGQRRDGAESGRCNSGGDIGEAGRGEGVVPGQKARRERTIEAIASTGCIDSGDVQTGD